MRSGVVAVVRPPSKWQFFMAVMQSGATVLLSLLDSWLRYLLHKLQKRHPVAQASVQAVRGRLQQTLYGAEVARTFEDWGKLEDFRPSPNLEQRFNDYPIVYIHGMFGWGKKENNKGTSYWSSTAFSSIIVDVGPLSDAHVRACEVFYQIKGGCLRFGDDYEKKYPIWQGWQRPRFNAEYAGWDSQHPVHLVTHSFGGNTARHLQHLLSLGDFFRDEQGQSFQTSADWVASMTGIGTPWNGDMSDYLPLGLMRSGKRTLLAMQWLNLGMAGRGMKLDHWGINYKDVGLREGWTRLQNLLKLDVTSYDWLPFKTIQKKQSMIRDCDKTFYFSLAASNTSKTADGYHWPLMNMTGSMVTLAAWMGMAVPQEGEKLHRDFRAEEWLENDGSIPTKSQQYPLDQDTDESDASKHKAIDCGQHEHFFQYSEGDVQPGQWHFITIFDDHNDRVFNHENKNEAANQQHNHELFLHTFCGRSKKCADKAILSDVMRRQRRLSAIIDSNNAALQYAQ